jgi:MFS family permease
VTADRPDAPDAATDRSHDPDAPGDGAAGGRRAAVPTLAPLRVEAYRRIWTAALVSHVGTFLQLTAGPWLMNELTGSPLMVSLVTTAMLLPRLVLTLPAGVLADLFDRRTLLLTGQLVSSVSVATMAVLTQLGYLTPTSLLVLTFTLGVGNAITLPSFQTLVPDLVPRALLAQAITLNSAAFNVARALGPSLGGALVAIGLAQLAFGLNAVTYLAVVGVLLTFPRETVDADDRQPFLRSAAQGVRYVRFTRPIRQLLAVSSGFAITAASVQALLPSVVSDDLGIGPTGFGILYGLFGAGALSGALTRERARVRFGRWMLPGSVVAFGLGGVTFGLAPGGAVAGVGLALAGLTWVWTLTTLNASIQILAPKWVRGRVVSLYLVTIGLQPIGAFVAGATAELTGAGVSVALLTGATILLGVVLLRIDLPVLGELSEPAPAPDDWSLPRHARAVGGSPIVVATTWDVEPDRLSEFLDVLRELRRQRFRTGATRWSVFRDADRPHVVTELFSVPDWAEHLAQHRRIDADVVAVLDRARSFDRVGGPRTRHLAGLDLVDHDAAPLEEQLLTVHEELHRRDGSVPLDQAGAGAPATVGDRAGDDTGPGASPRPSGGDGPGAAPRRGDGPGASPQPSGGDGPGAAPRRGDGTGPGAPPDPRDEDAEVVPHVDVPGGGELPPPVDQVGGSPGVTRDGPGHHDR